MAAALDEPAPLIERIGNVLLNGLFGLGLIARDQKGKSSGLRQGASSFGAASFVIASVIEAGQMLAFPFSATQRIWDNTVVGSIVAPMLTVVMPASADVWFGPMAYQVMFFLGIAWVLIFISLSISIAVAFIREKKQSEFALRLFRGVAVLSTTALFLPVSSLLFRSYSCSAGSSVKGSTNDWLGAGIPCDNEWRLIILGFVAVLLALFFILATFVAATFVDRRPGSLRWAAKSHGRVAVALLMAKVVLTAIYNVSPTAARSIGTTVTLIVVALGWLVSLYRELPMLRPVANALRAGSAAAFLWANVMLLVAQLMPENNISTTTLLGIPVAALAGGMLVLTEARRVVNGKLSDCVSVSHIVLWASARVQEAEQIQRKAEGTPVAIAIDRLADAFRLRYVEQVDNAADVSHAPRKRQRVRRASLMPTDAATVAPFEPHARGLEAEAIGGAALSCGVPADNDAEATAKHRLRLLAAAEEAYRTAMKSEASGLALVAAAKFYETFSPNTQQEVDCIAKLKAMQPAPDLAFVVFVRGIELSDSTAAEGGLAAIDRVMFEQMADETRALRATALRSMVELWAHLEQKRPDLWQVLQTGARLDADIVRCDFLFSRMLRLNPESTTILRAYSGFLSGLGFDPVRGMELRNRADRIDEVASRQRVSKVASVSLFSYGASLKGNRQLQLALTDASSPVVTISASSSNRGEIVAVTPAAAKLLLATRAGSLIGQNISTIVPPPFQDFHQHMLDGFGRSITAKSSIVGHEITLPVARRDGTIIACNLTVDESPPDATTMQPRLAAVLHPVPSAHDLVLFTGEADGFRIASASRGALSLFGVDPGTLKDRHIPLTSFLPSLSPSFVPFAGSASGRAEIHALRDAASLADSGTSASAAATPSHAKHRGGGRGAGAGSSLLAQVKPDKRGVARVRVAPMLSLKETGLVPLEFQGAPFATVLAGSVQCMRMMGSEVFLLRFVPTRLVIPAGVPLDGSEASMVLEDHPDAGPRSSMSEAMIAHLESHGPGFDHSSGQPRRGPAAMADVPERDEEQQGEAVSVDSAGVALSQEDDDGESNGDSRAPRLDLALGRSVLDSQSDPVAVLGDPSVDAPEPAPKSGPGQPAASQSAPDSKALLTQPDAARKGDEKQPGPQPVENADEDDGKCDESEMAELLRPSEKDLVVSPAEDQPPAKPAPSGTTAPTAPRGSPPVRLVQVSSHGRVMMPKSSFKHGSRGSMLSAVSASAIATGQRPSVVQVDDGGAAEIKATTTGHTGGFGGGASSAGGSSTGSATQISGLLRAVLRRNDGREPETNRIRTVLLLSAACVVLASAGAALWVEASRETFAGYAEGLRQSVARYHDFHRAWVAATAIFTNVTGASPVVVAPVDALHTELIESSDRMHVAAKALHDAGAASGPAGAAYDLAHTFETVEPPADGNEEAPVRKMMTISEAEAFIYGVFTVMRALKPPQWVSNPIGWHAFVTLRANEAEIRGAFERSLGHREQDFALLLPAMANQIIYAGAAFLVVVILSSLVAITVAVTALWRHSVSTMQLFLSFSAEVAGALRQLAAIQLEAADTDGAGEFEDDVSDDEEEDARRRADVTSIEVPASEAQGDPRNSKGASQGEAAPSSSPSRPGSRRGLLQSRIKSEDDGATDEAMRNQVINEADAVARWEAVLASLKSSRRATRGRRGNHRMVLGDRNFNVSNGFVFSSLVRLLLPVLMIGAWLATVVLVSTTSFDRSSGQANRILQTSHVQLHADELESYALLALADHDRIAEVIQDPDWQVTTVADTSEAEGNLNYESDVLLFGGESCSAIDICSKLEPIREDSDAIAPLAAAILSRDGCIGAPAADMETCYKVGGGSLGRGVLAATVRMTSLARLFVKSRLASNSSKPQSVDVFRVTQLMSLLHPHGRAAIRRASLDLIDSTLEVIVEGQNVVLTSTWVFALLYLGVTAVWLSTQVAQLSWPLRTARRLVRFLPAELVLAIPSLRYGLREVASGVSVTTVRRQWCPRLKCQCCRRSTRRVAISTPATNSKGESI
ncbi:hypothetical protein FNF27_02964 [Cafeteria roenbergensis]|uniref:TmcB/TmcC TPR repeats domain-containing protein n=1 Tax=Cafeteria roenbergensis TaxID=33653 RepID=A0A5A8EEC3_CAFRO|nr:hypothetical protein FNF27_02964 [Cafeteria roenbergensis]